jgi:hypothetical protein
MKQLLFFLFFPLAVYGQTSNTGHSISGPFTNRPSCSGDISDSKAHDGDVYRDTDDKIVYKCLGGTWRIFPGASTSPTNSANPFVSNTHESDKESAAYQDIRAHGAYARFSSTTCNTRSGSPRVTLGAPSNFKNGEYATCYNAGKATTVARQSTPAVTPSVHDGGMTASAGGGGSTVYAYEIVGEDAYNGRSAASSAGSTSTGTATLGKIGNTLADCTRSNRTVTCTTGSRHDFIPGMQIWVAGMSDPTFNGNWVTIVPTSGTTVTYASGWDTRNGATTSSAVSGTELGYNVWGWKMNRVSWRHDSTSYRHHIYGPNCPAICNWMGQTLLDYWDDYGSTMGGNQTRPSYIPSVAPHSSANQHFTFQIISGSGTTMLTAGATAGATQAGNAIVSDVGPAIIAAAIAAAAPGMGTLSNVFIPNVGMNWEINSYTNLYKKNASIVVNGSNLIFNQPVDNAAAIIGTGSGSVQSFGWSPSPKITGIGYPLVVNSGGAGTVPILKNLDIVPGQSNGGLAIYLSTPTNIDWDTIFLNSSPGSTSDCIGQAVVIQNINTGFFWNINKFTFAGGACEVDGTQYTGDSPVPFFTSTSTPSGAGSGLYVKQGWFVNRGGINLDYQESSAGNTITLERAWMQNNTVPAISWSGPGSNSAATIRIVDIFPADFATPTFVNYGYTTGTLVVQNVNPPNGGMSSFTGNAIPGISAQNIGPSSFGTDSNSFNQTSGIILDGIYTGTGSVQALTQMNEHFALGAGYSLFTNTPQPAAPTCSVAAAGPPYTPAGTWTYVYSVAYPPNDGTGPLSRVSSGCVSNGTSQQITITIPSAVAGASGYTIYAANQGKMLSCSSPTTTSLTYVQNSGACGPSEPALPGGGPAGISGSNVNAGALVLGAEPAPAGVTHETKLYMDSTANWPAFKPNGNRAYLIPGIHGPILDGHSLCSSGTTGVYVDCQMTRTVAIGTSTLGTTLIAAKTCSAVVTTQATGVIASDVISYSFSAAPSGAFTTGLVIQSYVTPGSINFLVCNPTENGLVPPAATLNWRVVR